VGVFQSLKHSFKKELRKEIFQGATEISRVDFFSFFQRFHHRIFKNPRIHKSAFRKTGLIPLNPMVVLSKMKEYHAIQPTVRPQTPPQQPPSSPLLFSSSPTGLSSPPPLPTRNWTLFQTPLTIRSRKSGIDYVRKRQFDAMEGRIPITPSVVHVSDKVEKAALTSMYKGALSTNRLLDLRVAEEARKRRKESSGKVVQKYGEIYGKQARKQIEADIQDELKVVNMRDKRLQYQSPGR